MKIFVLNQGSSSIKCFLYEFTKSPTLLNPIWEAHLQWKNGFVEPFLKIKNEKGKQHAQAISEKTPALGLNHLLTFLIEGETSVVGSFDEIDAIGHRIVHGGRYFTESVLITGQVKEKIGLLAELAPLHNISQLESIALLEQLFKKTPQIAVFDTAFHQSLPKASQIYPGPYRWYEEGIQRYGFHGISYQYCSRRCAELLHTDLPSLKMVICHLGAGASLCGIKDGKSIDTTMGFTPLEGLMMDTRSGSIDPGILLHLLKKKSLQEISHELYNESGLLGVSGISSDMRDIIKKSEEGNSQAILTIEVYLHRLRSCIGSMLASLNGLDVLVFTAGIGENSSLIREKVCESFSFLGVNLDTTQNAAESFQDRILSSSDSKVTVCVIHTQEAFEIAKECWNIVTKKLL